MPATCRERRARAVSPLGREDKCRCGAEGTSRRGAYTWQDISFSTLHHEDIAMLNISKISRQDLDRVTAGKRISLVRSEPVNAFGKRSSRLTVQCTDGTRHVLESSNQA